MCLRFFQHHSAIDAGPAVTALSQHFETMIDDVYRQLQRAVVFTDDDLPDDNAVDEFYANAIIGLQPGVDLPQVQNQDLSTALQVIHGFKDNIIRTSAEILRQPQQRHVRGKDLQEFILRLAQTALIERHRRECQDVESGIKFSGRLDRVSEDNQKQAERILSTMATDAGSALSFLVCCCFLLAVQLVGTTTVPILLLGFELLSSDSFSLIRSMLELSMVGILDCCIAIIGVGILAIVLRESGCFQPTRDRQHTLTNKREQVTDIAQQVLDALQGNDNAGNDADANEQDPLLAQQPMRQYGVLN